MDQKKLKSIPIDSIEPNPENPRIIFRQEELDNLLVSINKIGIQVPISVYQEDNKYIIIDGQRRYITCKKLNHKFIPAIIQEKPSELDNLLLMFNIHALREQWDIFTIAMKIPRIKKLFKKKTGYEPTESELSKETGLTRGTIRRCNMIIDLPERFKNLILDELKKSKSKQILSEDFFLEMESSLKTVIKRFPIIGPRLDLARDILIEKYKSSVIPSVTDFRMLSKIATAPKNVNYNSEEACNAIELILFNKDIGIQEVFNNTVADKYGERKFFLNLSNFIYYLSNLKPEEKKNKKLKSSLLTIKEIIDKLLNEED